MFHPFLAFVFTAGRGTTVPYPNNLTYPPIGGGSDSDKIPTFFIEFPSFPRMSLNEYNIASRGNHPPVLEYTLPDGEDTRSGNTGLYFNLVADLDTESPPSTILNFLTAVAKLGNVPEFSVYQVPGLGRDFDGTVFDVFPGSPAIQDDGIIAFKGNYAIPVEATDGSTVTISQTGVFYRQLTQDEGGGDDNLYVVANSQTLIPERNHKCKST